MLDEEIEERICMLLMRCGVVSWLARGVRGDAWNVASARGCQQLHANKEEMNRSEKEERRKLLRGQKKKAQCLTVEGGGKWLDPRLMRRWRWWGWRGKRRQARKPPGAPCNAAAKCRLTIRSQQGRQKKWQPHSKQ